MCCAALGGVNLKAQDMSPSPSASRGAVGNENPETDSTYGGHTNPKNPKMQHGRQTDTKTNMSGNTSNVTGSNGPSTGGAAQTNSSYGGGANKNTHSTVGSTSNTNPNASTGNMNPQGSATGQTSSDGMDGTTHRPGKAHHHHRKQHSEDMASPSASPIASASPGT